jgi:hypothetical protein
VARYITLHSISSQEHRFLQRLLWASIGILLFCGLAFAVLVTAKPVPTRVGRKLLGVLLILAVLAVEGLLYFWRRHYTHKKVVEGATPGMYGVFNTFALTLGILGLLYTAVLLSR